MIFYFCKAQTYFLVKLYLWEAKFPGQQIKTYVASFSNTWWLKVFSQNSFIYETQQDQQETFLMSTISSKLDLPTKRTISSGCLRLRFPSENTETTGGRTEPHLNWWKHRTLLWRMTEDPHPCTSHTAGTRYKCFSPGLSVRPEGQRPDGRPTHLKTCELDVHPIECQLEWVFLDELRHFAHNIVGGCFVLRTLPITSCCQVKSNWQEISDCFIFSDKSWFS